MPDYDQIYRTQAEQYEQLVSREDYQQNILPALQSIRSLEGLDVVELGAGTGRLSCMLAPLVKSLRLLDISQAMLEVTAAKLEKSGRQNWQIQVADHRHLPLPDQAADLVISGWSICYGVMENQEVRPANLDQILKEMKRALRPGGTIIILETQGTGFETPHPPDFLVPYYALLEAQGFASRWIRTDYQFDSLDQAEALARFFFGDELADKVRRENWVILPECTGIWWLGQPSSE